MRELVVLGVATEEETLLAHVEVEALEASVAEAHDRVLLADVALGLVLGRLRRRQAMEHGQPDEALGFVLQPAEEVLQLNGDVLVAVDGLLRDAGLLQAGPHRGLDVGATKGGHFTELAGYLKLKRMDLIIFIYFNKLYKN